MKTKLPVVAIALMLSGCQTLTPGQDSTETQADTTPKATQPAVDKTAQVKPAQPALPPPPEDVWERIRTQMALDVPDNPRVEKFRKWYLNNPNHLNIISQRAEPFMYLIVEEIEKRGLPIELALLPIVESSFDVFAYSHGAAAGIWQFTAPMGRHFGLQQNWWYDGRRDVYHSTIAAMDMMEYLHGKLHNDWYYALAAYNTGEGRVFRAIRNNRNAGKPTDYFALNLPRETERYVPQLLALADVIKNADKYGITLNPIANEPALKLVDAGSQIDLSLAADLADMSVGELHKLNPGYNRWATAPDGPHTLLLPVDKVDGFITALADTESAQRVNWVRYTVKPGDSLGLIAQKYHTRVGVIQSVNKLEGNLIRAGQALLIPVAAKDQEDYVFSAEQRLARQQSTKRAEFKTEHVVQSGESLWTIARANKVTVDQLARWNGMAPSDTLRPGRKLVIWVNRVSETQTKSSVMRQVTYTVRSGDSLARIGQRFNVTVNDLIRWNKLQGQKYLQPGQRLTLYVDVTRVNS
ncbi:LysM peptidoglycan-binding domain-containing protein [Ferrimonas balearica]|uniref:LysM peptidoglycan-binding domain-containing protein n=1 Tax=Ferrimonas balearica TaxID=44012 RepID=UPI001C9A1F85|nr:LysM peptidoglycan-binding domain-containing protein [Ferrimonas balearica]MBY5992012.1 LysM peptidoglycan-binding domain-containing protein [Ferrimonas balearica]